MIYLGMKEVKLYGGAATCMMPADWLDASNFRDVPDHQEVYIHPTGDGEQSVIIEILQYDDKLTDDEAGAYYFNDLANADGANSSIIDVNHAPTSKVDILGGLATRVDTSGVHMKAKLGPASPTMPIVVLMSLIRAPHIDSDILITCHSLRETSSEIRKVHDSIVGSLRFLDNSLFL